MNQSTQLSIADQAQNALTNARSARPTAPAVHVKVEIGVPYHRFSFDKNQITIIKPNGEKVRATTGEVNCVIIGSAIRPGRVYFRGTYGDGQSGQPECLSRDGRVPVDLPGKQADLCANCPQNVPGSGSADGSGDYKACSMTLPIVVVPVVWSNQEARWLVQPVPVLLRVSASAFMDDVTQFGMGYKAYNALLEGASVNLSEVVTRIMVNHDNDVSCVPNFLNVDYADDSVQNELLGVLDKHRELIEMMTDVAGFSAAAPEGSTSVAPAPAIAATPPAPALPNETIDTSTGEVMINTAEFRPATPDQLAPQAQPAPAPGLTAEQQAAQAATQAAAAAHAAQQAPAPAPEVDASTAPAPRTSPRRSKAEATAAVAPVADAAPAPMGGASAGDFSL